METTCDCCDKRISTERDSYEYEPLGILVCEECNDMLTSCPMEEPDTEMEDLMANMTISADK